MNISHINGLLRILNNTNKEDDTTILNLDLDTKGIILSDLKYIPRAWLKNHSLIFVLMKHFFYRNEKNGANMLIAFRKLIKDDLLILTTLVSTELSYRILEIYIGLVKDTIDLKKSFQEIGFNNMLESKLSYILNTNIFNKTEIIDIINQLFKDPNFKITGLSPLKINTSDLSDNNTILNVIKNSDTSIVNLDVEMCDLDFCLELLKNAQSRSFRAKKIPILYQEKFDLSKYISLFQSDKLFIADKRNLNNDFLNKVLSYIKTNHIKLKNPLFKSTEFSSLYYNISDQTIVESLKYNLIVPNFNWSTELLSIDINQYPKTFEYTLKTKGIDNGLLIKAIDGQLLNNEIMDSLLLSKSALIHLKHNNCTYFDKKKYSPENYYLLKKIGFSKVMMSDIDTNDLRSLPIYLWPSTFKQDLYLFKLTNQSHYPDIIDMYENLISNGLNIGKFINDNEKKLVLKTLQHLSDNDKLEIVKNDHLYNYNKLKFLEILMPDQYRFLTQYFKTCKMLGTKPYPYGVLDNAPLKIKDISI